MIKEKTMERTALYPTKADHINLVDRLRFLQSRCKLRPTVAMRDQTADLMREVIADVEDKMIATLASPDYQGPACADAAYTYARMRKSVPFLLTIQRLRAGA